MRQQINHVFGERLNRTDQAIIAVITPEGNEKHLRVRPDKQPSSWLVFEWGKDSAGRNRQLVSVELTSERIAAGAVFTRDAYIEEDGWPEGWDAYQKYIDAIHTKTITDKNGRTSMVRLSRPVDHLHFPREHLPRRAAANVAKIKADKLATEWVPPEGLERPKAKAKAK